MNAYTKSISIVSIGVLVLLLLGYILGNTFTSLIISFAAAYFLFPLIKKVEKWGIPRGIVVFLTTVIMFAILLLLGFFLVPLILEEIAGFISSLPFYLSILMTKIIMLGDAVNVDMRSILQKYLDEHAMVEWIRANISNISKYLLVPFLKLSKSGLDGIMNLLLLLINLFIIPIFFFFLVGSYEKITELISDLFPPEQRDIMKGYLEKFNTVLNGYFRGQLALSIFLSAYFAIVLSLIGVRFGLLIGICTGLLNIIPYVGVTVSIFFSIISVLVYSPEIVQDILLIVAVYGLEAAIEAPLIYPKLVGSKVNLRPLETMLALASGANLGGILGVLIAIPVAASLKFVILDAIERYRNSSFYLAKSAS